MKRSLLISALLVSLAGVVHAEDEVRHGLALPFGAPSAESRKKADEDASREARLIRRYRADIADCRKNVGGERQACETIVRSRAQSKVRREAGRLPLILRARSVPRRKVRGRPEDPPAPEAPC